MVKRRTGLDPLAYMGVEPSMPAQFVRESRVPTTTDYENFNIGTVWLVRTTNQVFMLVDKANLIGTWREFTAGVGAINTLTGDVGGAVPPTANNIDIQGGDHFIFTGNPGASLLTLTSDGTVATQFDTDAGSAIPVADILNILGGTGVTTAGAGNTVTISTAGSVAVQVDADVGSAVPAGGILNVFGANGIATSAAGNTVTVDVTAGAFVKTLTGVQGGGAIPPDGADNINLTGAGGVTVTGAGNTLTISGAGVGGLDVKVTKFTASGNFVKDASSVYMTFIIWDAGHGGGSGRQGLTGAAGGGGGGAGGNIIIRTVFANQLAGSEVVTIGAAGTGGPTQAGASSNGNDGGFGGITSIANLFASYAVAATPNLFPHGRGGINGTSGSGATQQLYLDYHSSPGNAVSAHNGGGQGGVGVGVNAIIPTPYATGSSFIPPGDHTAGGGGGGSGANSGAAQQAGAGGTIVAYALSPNVAPNNFDILNAGGAGGIESAVINGVAGLNFISTTGVRVVGSSGGGGGGGQSGGAVGGIGGAGGVPGAGGGGGGGSLNGTTSGAGGAGGRGELWVFEYLGTLT